MENFYGYKYINGFKIDFFGFDNEKDQLLYHDGYKTRKAIRHYVCPFGGNPFPGTIIEWYQIILPNNKRVKYNIRA